MREPLWIPTQPPIRHPDSSYPDSRKVIEKDFQGAPADVKRP